MSTVYNLEPPPTAKVILHTTSGSILLELFAQQTPLASRNFLQHCLDGYYTDTIFHRVVPGFIIQGGDPTGTGMGGVSSYDEPTFADEFHSRLKFNRRGLLGMANTEKNENASQFFLTLGKTEELTGRNTMFGRVEGDTIFNLVKMGEAELVESNGSDNSERPMYPTRITGADILVNPFEDMVRRIPETVPRGKSQKEITKTKTKKKVGKGMLSFGGDAEDEEDIAPIVKPKFNSKVLSGGKDSIAPKRSAPDAVADRPRKRRATPSPSPSPPAAYAKTRVVHASEPKSQSRGPSPSLSPSPEPESPKVSALDRANAQIASLKASLQRNTVSAPAESTKRKSALESMIPSTATRGRRRKPGGGGSGASALGGTMSKDERRALEKFDAFRKRLESAPATDSKHKRKDQGDGSNGTEAEAFATKPQEKNGNGASADDEEALLCELHFVPNCQSCKKWDEAGAAESGASEDEADTDWMSHRLTFEKDRLGKDLEWKRQNEKELVVIDPREKAKELAGDRKKRAKMHAK